MSTSDIDTILDTPIFTKYFNYKMVVYCIVFIIFPNTNPISFEA